MVLSTVLKSSPGSCHGAGDEKVRSVKARGRKKKLPSPHASLFYRNLTPAYEMVRPMVASRNIWSSIKALPIAPGERLLEVGVGTGLSLSAYPKHARVTGVDLSEEMLAKANERI